MNNHKRFPLGYAQSVVQLCFTRRVVLTVRFVDLVDVGKRRRYEGITYR